MNRYLCYFIFFSLCTSQHIFSQTCPSISSAAGLPYYSICPVGGSVTLGNPAIPGFAYSWTPSTGLNNPFIAQPIANPTSSTAYTLNMYQTANNLIQNGDFESGFAGFNTDYNIYPNGRDCVLGNTAPFGSETVTNNPAQLNTLWCLKPNHTSNGANMLAIDGACSPNMRVWSQTVNIVQNTSYFFSGWHSALGSSNESNAIPTLRVRINGVDIIQNIRTPWVFSCPTWQFFSTSWFSGNSTTATIEIFDDNLEYTGNDFCLDDLYFSSCQSIISQTHVCVCQPAISETVTVKIPISLSFQMEKFNTNNGIYCLNQQTHKHSTYENSCGGYQYSGMLSGYLPADNNQPSYQSFEAHFMMQPSHNGVFSYLSFPQHSLQLYDFCREADIISATMKLFHKQANYPICERFNHYSLTQPHSGQNGFTVKRTNQIKNHWSTCGTKDYSIYNYDNPPPTSNEIINVPASTSQTQDYSINVTQMVKNSLQITSSSYLGFVIQQSQNSTYNNVFFEGAININNDFPEPGEAYIELTYIRRSLPQSCSISRNSTTHKESSSPTNFLDNNLTIYPNPSNSIVNINSLKQIENIDIYTINGKLVLTLPFNKRRVGSIDVSGLSSGIYLIMFKTESGIKSQKLVIQH